MLAYLLRATALEHHESGPGPSACLPGCREVLDFEAVEIDRRTTVPVRQQQLHTPLPQYQSQFRIACERVCLFSMEGL